MKILFISQDYFPQVSGVPVVVQYLAEGLAQKGHEVSVATCRRNNDIYNEIINSVSVYRLDIYQNILKQPAGCIREYIEFVCNFECDVVILECTQCITSDLLIPHLDRIRAMKILHAHGFSGLTLLKNARIFKMNNGFKHTIGHFYNWIRSWYYFSYWLPRYVKYFDCTMVLSDVDSAKEYLDNYLGERNYVLENAADDMFFCDYSSEVSTIKRIITLKSSHYCFSCANYTVVKNQKQLIEQFYKADVDDLALVCIGRIDNAYYYECKRLIEKFEKQYGYREVHLLHGVDRKYIPLIESQATMYLVSSTFEEYSISVIEAMAQGIPFISTNVGNSIVLPGGITLDHIEDMHQAIRQLSKDQTLYLTLSAKGKEYAYSHNRKQKAIDTLENIIVRNI